MTSARILLVEDEAIIAMETEASLIGLGYEVAGSVDTGKKAISIVDRDRPDLVVMDINIKGDKDGIDTAEIIRNQFDIPVVFATAYLDEERIERAKITTPFGFIIKPIQQKDLKVTIEMALYANRVEQKRLEAEQRARENEIEYKALFNAMNDGVCVHRMIYDNSGTALDYEIIEINEKYEKILGMSREIVINQLASTLYKSDTPPYLNIYENVVRTRKPVRFETYYEPMDMHFSIAVFSTKPKHFATVFQDISHYKQAETVMRKSEEKHRTLFELMLQGIVYLDIDGNLMDVNPAAERILGLPKEKLLQRNVSDKDWKMVQDDGKLFPIEQHPAVQALKSGKTVEDIRIGVFNPETKNYRWISIIAIPRFLKDSDTHYEFYVIFRERSPHPEQPEHDV